MHKLIFAALAAVSTLLFAAARDDSLILVVLGSNERAMLAAYVEPYRKETGRNVSAYGYDGHIDRYGEMVRTGNVRWDLMQVESRNLEIGCRDGLFEKLDVTKIGDARDFVPGAIAECGIGNFVWSHVFVYDADRVKGTPPHSWADFWNVDKFPGKRGLKRSAKYTLEIALLADGVAPADIYKVLATKEGVDRAFRKLDQIKADVVWWEAAPQPALFMNDGRMAMSASYALWIDDEQRHGKNYRIVWNGSLYDFDFLAIPRGAPKVDEAYKFLAFVSKPQSQKAFAEQIGYGPVNKRALALMEPKVASALPTAEANLKGALAMSSTFWIRYGAELEKRFDRWAPPIVHQTDEEHAHPAH